MRDFLAHLTRDHAWQAAALVTAFGIGMILAAISVRGRT